MMPRKKRILVIMTIILVLIISIVGVGSYLYFNTDMFRTNEELFTKYFVQNFNIVGNIANSNLNNEIEMQLNQNKYVSELTGKIEYTENLNTTTENKDSVVNDIWLKVDSQIDKQNDYFYRDIKLIKEENAIIGLESLIQNDNNYIRYSGIKQFLKIDQQEVIDISKNVEIGTILQYLNINEEEKQIIKNNYLGIIREYITNESYGKQENAMITLNSQTVNTNAYYLNITNQQIRDIKLKMLETLKQDELIWNKVEELKNKLNIEEDIKQQILYYLYKSEMISNIENAKKEEVNDSSIKITVYESEGKLARTIIETQNDRYVADVIDDNTMNIEMMQKENDSNKIALIIQNVTSTNELKISLNNISDDEILNGIVIGVKLEKKEPKILKVLNLSIYNEKHESKLSITENIEIVNEFEKKVEEKLQNNIIDLNTLNEEQKETIKNIITKDAESKISQIDWSEYAKMIVNIFEGEEKVEIKYDNGIEETEKNRFNSNFEFFVGDGLAYNNIQDLMGYVKNNLDSIQINNIGSEQSKEIVVADMANKKDTELEEYIKNIDSFVINIEKNNSNEELSNVFLQLIEKLKDRKFDIGIEYDDNEMVNMIKIKIQNEE